MNDGKFYVEFQIERQRDPIRRRISDRIKFAHGDLVSIDGKRHVVREVIIATDGRGDTPQPDYIVTLVEKRDETAGAFVPR